MQTIKFLLTILNSKRGHKLAEYALVSTLLAVVAIVLLLVLGGRLNEMFFKMSSGKMPGI